jgi:hypothetical protein
LIGPPAPAPTTGGFFYQVDNFTWAVEGFFGASGTNWLVTLTACVQMPALLAVMWALRRLAGRIGEHVTSTLDMPGNLAGALMLVPAGVIGAIAVCRNWALLTPLTPSVAPVLLIIVYLFVAEASARLPRWQNLTWVIKALTVVVLVAAVFVPLLDVFAPTGPSTHQFATADALLRTTIAGLVVAAAAGVAMRWPHLVGVDAGNAGENGEEKPRVPTGKR